MEKKRLLDLERAYLDELRSERENAERLLLNVLPRPIADRLKAGERTIADHFPDVTVLFADLVGFSKLSAQLAPHDLVSLMNEIFSSFDRLAEHYGLEKIKTIGDAYMVAGGLPTPREDHAETTAKMAVAMLGVIDGMRRKHGTELAVRIGIHSGPVIAGVISTQKFAYDLWGETVNIASRMESHGVAGRIQLSCATHERLNGKFPCEERGTLEVKGIGPMQTYLLGGRVAAPC